MKNLWIAVLFLVGCASPMVARPKPVKTHKARLTFYHGKHERVAWTGKRAVEGVSVAAEPARKFGQWVKIPELAKYLGSTLFQVQDRGSAVTRRRASHGKTEVIDVFVASLKKMNWLAKVMPEYVEITDL